MKATLPVCSVSAIIDDMLASGSLLMLAMTWCMAWPLPGLLKLGPRAARTGRTFLWFFTAVTLRQSVPFRRVELQCCLFLVLAKRRCCEHECQWCS